MIISKGKLVIAYFMRAIFANSLLFPHYVLNELQNMRIREMSAPLHSGWCSNGYVFVKIVNLNKLHMLFAASSSNLQ